MTSVLRYFTSTSPTKIYLFNCEIKADALQSEIDKLFYFSYRSGFAPLSLNTDAQNSVTTDSGWGCTYRAGQMLFAHALNVLLLKSNPNWSGLNSQTPNELIEILELFADVPAESESENYWMTGRYSIHRCVQCAHQLYDKSLREWIGPDSMSSILKVLTEHAPQSPVRVVVSRDRTFNPAAVHRSASGDAWKPVLVIAPLLLGLKSSLPNLYIQPLLATLKLEHSLGVIGGRPSAAYWLIGCEEQGDHVTLLALDPHVTRACTGTPINRSHHAAFVAHGVSRLKLTELDACLAVAFLCPTTRDIDKLAHSLALLADRFSDPLLSVSTENDSDSESDVGVSVSVNFAQDDFDMT